MHLFSFFPVLFRRPLPPPWRVNVRPPRTWWRNECGWNWSGNQEIEITKYTLWDERTVTRKLPLIRLSPTTLQKKHASPCPAHEPTGLIIMKCGLLELDNMGQYLIWRPTHLGVLQCTCCRVGRRLRVFLRYSSDRHFPHRSEKTLALSWGIEPDTFRTRSRNRSH